MNAPTEHERIATCRRNFALQVVERLRGAGYEALWAGGCVRDLLLEMAPTDYDVATSARPDQVRELFGQRRTLAVGAAFGVIIVLGSHPDAGQVEVATFRNDAGYSDGRRPDAVTFSTAVEDAARRDFTINGMFYDPLTQSVIDYVGGRDDLSRGLIRAIGNADARIAEDKLRMLRAVRFAARFGFAMEAATEAALARHYAELSVVSGERMSAEMHKTLITQGREFALRTWASTGLLKVLLPEVAQLWTSLEEPTCALLRAVEAQSWIGPLSAILFPLYAGTADRSSFIARIGADLKGRLKLSNDEVNELQLALGAQDVLASADRLLWSQVQPYLTNPAIQPGLDLMAARVACGDVAQRQLDWVQQRLAWSDEKLNPPTLIGGRDLQSLGLRPGPQFKQLLTQVRDAQLDGELNSPAAALQWLRDQIDRN